MENALLYDWFTCSFKVLDFSVLIDMLDMRKQPWKESEKGSRMRYAHRLEFDGISIHYTEEADNARFNPGCCLEMSGQGCRDFEQFGSGDWDQLVRFCIASGGNITRVDIAFDDFTGVLPIDIISKMAMARQFTSQSQHLRIMSESVDRDPSHDCISVCPGSKSSDIYIRIYDKRVERKRWELEHWVRCEIQLREHNAIGFLTAAGGLGDRYCGVLANYLVYRCAGADSNVSRHPVAPFWAAFLRDASRLSINSRRDTEYNRARLDAHIYDRNHRAIKTAILADGLPEFLRKTFEDSEALPKKYQSLLESAENSANILRILGEPQPRQLRDLSAQLDDLQGIV